MSSIFAAAGWFRIAPDHPSLPGHFPGRPVVPGVVLLDHVLALVLPAGAKPAALFGVKFLVVVRPDETVEVRAARHAAGRIGFLGQRDGIMVLRGSVALAS